MITTIGNNDIPSDIGIKAKNLMVLRRAGYPVPDGIVLDGAVYTDLIAQTGIAQQLTEEFDTLWDPAQPQPPSQHQIARASQRCQALFQGVELPASLAREIEKALDPAKRYAVRSSGTAEDLPDFSFAGQYATTLNVGGLADICAAILTCYRSLFSQAVLSYLVNTHLRPEEFTMAVIIQQMVDADTSGVAFTINPLSGDDRELVVEVAPGLGDALVSGQVNPKRITYNWYDDQVLQNDSDVEPDLLRGSLQTFLSIQTFFGYPCDIEFAWQDGVLYILQARAITKILYSGISDQWTTADFKDGGVSAGVCTTFMWSLYDFVWEDAYRRFLHQALLVKLEDMGTLGKMFFGRPYWNLSMAKLGMAKVPGYKERDFDAGLGVASTYVGDGVITKLTPGTAVNAVRILLTHNKMTKGRVRNNPRLHDELLQTYHHYLNCLEDERTDAELEAFWLQLVFSDYRKSETTYFEQIFINTVGQSVYKDDLTKYFDESEYLNLLAGLNDISHLRTTNDLWAISRAIRDDPVARAYWHDTEVDAIKPDVDKAVAAPCLDRLQEHIKTFGYHSSKELDVTYPHYSEDPTPLVASLKEFIELDDERSPMLVRDKQEARFEEQLGALQEKRIPQIHKRTLHAMIEEMRSILWWREEFRDVSTRFYYLIRLVTKQLAQRYVASGIIANPEDVWHLSIEDIRSHIEGSLDADKLQEILRRNARYYDSFSHFTGENEIGRSFSVQPNAGHVTGKHSIVGIGACGGVTTGRARVIDSLEQIDRLQLDDILITKFTDTGWTSKFTILKGVVTEYGGVLCHAAIVSREYGIPCVVCVPDATSRIKDGALISIDGSTGCIEILEG